MRPRLNHAIETFTWTIRKRPNLAQGVYNVVGSKVPLLYEVVEEILKTMCTRLVERKGVRGYSMVCSWSVVKATHIMANKQ